MNAAFGQGITSSPILLDDVLCSGLERRLFDCTRGSLNAINNCGHHQDAGVVCMAGITWIHLNGGMQGLVFSNVEKYPITLTL